jgi:hypothetical protein
MDTVYVLFDRGDDMFTADSLKYLKENNETILYYEGVILKIIYNKTNLFQIACPFEKKGGSFRQNPVDESKVSYTRLTKEVHYDKHKDYLERLKAEVDTIKKENINITAEEYNKKINSVKLLTTVFPMTVEEDNANELLKRKPFILSKDTEVAITVKNSKQTDLTYVCNIHSYNISKKRVLVTLNKKYEAVSLFNGPILKKIEIHDTISSAKPNLHDHPLVYSDSEKGLFKETCSGCNKKVFVDFHCVKCINNDEKKGGEKPFRLCWDCHTKEMNISEVIPQAVILHPNISRSEMYEVGRRMTWVSHLGQEPCNILSFDLNTKLVQIGNFNCFIFHYVL